MKKIILLLVIITTSFVVFSQNKIALTIIDPVDGDKSLDILLNNAETVEIDSQGDITAVTQWDGAGGFQEALVTANISAGGTPPGLAFSCTNSVDCITVTAAQTTVTVTVSPGATYCNEFAGVSTVPFNVTTNSVDPYITQLTRVINASTSSIYSVECGNNGGSSTKQTINVSLATAPTVSISPSSHSVTSGSNLINVTWAASANADECIFNGDWPSGTTINSYISTGAASGLPAGSFAFTNITTAKVLTVSCRNAIGTSTQAQETYSITGSNPDTWSTCADGSAANPILSGAEDRSILSGGPSVNGPPGSPADYNGLFEDLQGVGTFPFPGHSGDIVHLTLETGKYISAKFTTDGTDHDSSFNFTVPTNQEGPNSVGRTMTISTCPGDFTNNLNQVRCLTHSATLYWSTKVTPLGPPGFFCELEKNTTYYLNVVDSDNSENNNYDTSDCQNGVGYCGILGARTDVNF